MLNNPQPFDVSLEFLRNKIPRGAPYSHEDWVAQGEDVSVKAFFSSGVENVRFLERAQKLLLDYLGRNTERVIGPDGVERAGLKVGSRADFVEQLREFQLKEGMATIEDFRGNQNNLTEISSLDRLHLIFDTNIRQAYGYGRWKQSMHPVVLHAFPAARFVRNPGAKVKRPRHASHENEVRLKTDRQYWADFQNDPLIGGFAVPWAPYGFNSHMNQQEVSRREAISLGLVEEGERLTPQDISLNEAIKVNLENTDPALVERIRLKLKRRKELKNAIQTKADPNPDPTDVSSKISSDRSVPAEWDKKYLKDTMRSIDKVHSDGPLKPLRFKRTQDRSSSENASYNVANGTEEISLNKLNSPHLSIAHEVGHWLDDMAFKTRVKNITGSRLRGKTQDQKFKIIAESFGSYGGEFKGLIEAIKKSKAYTTIANDKRLRSATRGYLLSNHELLARSYAQWIAIKSKNPRMLDQLKSKIDKIKNGLAPADQWGDQDFKEIAVQMDEIFRKRGWLNE